MPIYEFKCRDCGTITEKFVLSIKTGGHCTCRNCGGYRTERIISRPAVLTGRSPVACSDSDYGYGNPVGVVKGNWPGNDDYIKLKGQQ